MKRFILVGTAILVIAGLYTGKTMEKIVCQHTLIRQLRHLR